MAVIQSGASTDVLTVDPTSKAARASVYDSAGNLLSSANRTALAETAGGVMTAGKDYKLSRTLRASASGDMFTSGPQILFQDGFNTAARNSTAWIETIATMASTITSGADNGLQLNSGSSTSSGQGIIEISHRQFPIIARAALVFRARLRFAGATNCFEEWGLSDQTSATTAVMTNGAFFRRDGAGALQPILATAGTEGAGPTMTAPATTDYAFYEIFVEDDRVLFQITSVTGVLISAQVMERGATGGSGTGVATKPRLFATDHLSAFFRVYNSGVAGTAPIMIINQCSVGILDAWATRDHRVAMSGIGLNSLTSPTAYTQAANWANSTVPANGTLSNTAAAYTTLGGIYRFAATAGAETDYALFGWTNPSPYTFYCTGIRIGEVRNEVVAVATTASVFEWAAAFNSSAVSLATAAPYTPMRVALGQQALPIAAAVAAITSPIDWRTGTPIATFPGRFLHIILRLPIGTATATEFFRGSVAIDGFFE